VLEVNTIGVFLCCRAVASHMRASKSCRIVNITSGTAFKGAPWLLHYVASKGVVMSMTRSLARELGNDNVTVNAVSPGNTLSKANLENAEFLATHRQAAIGGRVLQRDAWPEDLVGAVAFLASDDAAFIAGKFSPSMAVRCSTKACTRYWYETLPRTLVLKIHRHGKVTPYAIEYSISFSTHRSRGRLYGATPTAMLSAIRRWRT